MQISKITRVIGVGDMTRAITFYEALGRTVEDQNPHWGNLTCGDGNLALQAYRPSEPEIVHTMAILTVDDLETAIGIVEAAGGSLHERHDNPHAPVVLAHVVDTEGNVVQLAQPRWQRVALWRASGC